MQSEITSVLLLAALFGVAGAGIGGLIGALLGGRGKGLIPLLFNLSGGLMIAVVCFELLPQAYEMNLPLALWGFAAGAVGVMLLSAALHRGGDSDTESGAMRRTGLLVLLSLALHNFPEGLAIGSGLARDMRLGVMLGSMVMLHDVPEGMASGLPLRAGGMTAKRAVLLSVLCGFPTGLGALVGYAMGGISDAAIALNFGLAAGAMLQVTAGELLPRARVQGHSAKDTLLLSMGIAVGSLMTLMV